MELALGSFISSQAYYSKLAKIGISAVVFLNAMIT